MKATIMKKKKSWYTLSIYKGETPLLAMLIRIVLSSEALPDPQHRLTGGGGKEMIEAKTSAFY